MPKFRDIERGIAKGREEDFELPGGQIAKVCVMPLLAGRDREIEAAAIRYVEAQNKANPGDPPALAKAGEPTFERAVYAATILRAVLDADDGKPFFASIDEILDPDRGLDRDRLALLFEWQQQAQADFAPSAAGPLTSARYFEWLEKTATVEAGAELPFERSPRAIQRLFVRGICRSYRESLVSQLALTREVEQLRSAISSLPVKSGPGLASPADTTSFESSASNTTSEQG